MLHVLPAPYCALSFAAKMLRRGEKWRELQRLRLRLRSWLWLRFGRKQWDRQMQGKWWEFNPIFSAWAFSMWS